MSCFSNFKISKSFFPFLFIAILFFLSLASDALPRAIFNFNSSLPAISKELVFDEQTATIQAIEKNELAVVNITVYQFLGPVTDTGFNKLEYGSGTGFIISADGYILTNKHVVETPFPKDTQYRIILSSGQKYYAQLIATDPLYDLAVLKIYDKDLPQVELGSSSDLAVGQSVIAIGNALGRYQNSVTKGIISGLGRDFTAQDSGGKFWSLNNVIQTDAQINLGNSGGPLLNLAGQVIGVNVAVDRTGGGIGFAIPIDEVKPVIRSVKEQGQIIRPRLGIHYQIITPEMAVDQNLARPDGALIVSGSNQENGIVPDSPAHQAGLKVGDIIFEINAIKINKDNNLQTIIQRFKPGDRIGLKVQREDQVFVVEVVLDRF